MNPNRARVWFAYGMGLVLLLAVVIVGSVAFDRANSAREKADDVQRDLVAANKKADKRALKADQRQAVSDRRQRAIDRRKVKKIKGRVVRLTKIVVGDPGATGEAGRAGLTGLAGVSVVGGTGPSGLQGLRGPPGPTGFLGPQGPAGADGTNGTDGSNGQNGANGTDGATGPGSNDAQVQSQVAVYCDARGECRGPQGDPGPEPVSLTFVILGTTYICTDPDADGSYDCPPSP